MTPVISKLREQVQTLQAKLLITSFLVIKLLCKELLCFFSHKIKIATHQVSNLADGCYCNLSFKLKVLKRNLISPRSRLYCKY